MEWCPLIARFLQFASRIRLCGSIAIILQATFNLISCGNIKEIKIKSESETWRVTKAWLRHPHTLVNFSASFWFFNGAETSIRADIAAKMLNSLRMEFISVF